VVLHEFELTKEQASKCITFFSLPINQERMSSSVIYPSGVVSRSRLPSFEVQRDTRATLQAALAAKKLPETLAEIAGFIVSEKNTFINIENTDLCGDSDCDRDLILEDPQPVFPCRERKPTEGVLSPVRERGYSCMSSRARRSSCPPKLIEDNPSPSTTMDTDDFCEDSANGDDAFDDDIHPNHPVTATVPSVPGVSRHPPSTVGSVVYTTPNLSPSTTRGRFASETFSCLASVHRPGSPCASVPKTTVMLRNVPYAECQVGVLEMIKSKGFDGRFDFFYAPLDFNSGNNLGYAFVNLPQEEDVDEFFKAFDGLKVDKEGWSQKELQVCWARVQGRDPNVDHYRNSPVNEMPESFRPMIFTEEGTQVPFPRPDENVPRRPIPATSMYSGGGNRAVTPGAARSMGRPRFASVNYASSIPARRSRAGTSGSFSVQYK